MTCKTCENEFSGNYCNICGQKVTDRFTFRSIFSLIVDEILNVNQGLVYTVFNLTLYPGKVVYDYLSGKTKRYFNPIKYVAFWSLVYFLLASFFGFGESDIRVSGDAVLDTVDPFSQQGFVTFEKLYLMIYINYPDVFFLFLSPFFAVLSLLLQKGRRCNYFELCILYLYMVGQFTMLATMNISMMDFHGKESLRLFFEIGILVLFIKQFFNESWMKTIIKSLLVFFLGQVLYMATGFLVYSIAKVIVQL